MERSGFPLERIGGSLGKNFVRAAWPSCPCRFVSDTFLHWARVEEDGDTAELLERARNGDADVVGELLMRDAERLRRMVQLRLDVRLKGRVDAGDVLQEVHLEAARRLPDYLDKPDMPFFLWMRFLTNQRLAALCRHHLGVQARDVRREVPLQRGPPGATSVALAHCLSAHVTTPSMAAMRDERKVRLQEALDQMDPMDREVLALRHFEQLSNVEAAAELGINTAAASKRYVRALRRLKEILGDESL